MKISTRKKLLEDADETLKEIRKGIKSGKINEFDWKKHKQTVTTFKKMLQKKPDFQGAQARRLKQFRMKELEKKYANLPPNTYTPEQKQKEVDDILKEVERLRQHLQTIEEIPEDPAKQTELQKTLVNLPSVSPSEIKRDPTSAIYQDPVTGLYWNVNVGVPTIPPEILKFQDYELEDFKKALKDRRKTSSYYTGIPEWDQSRGFIWNIIRSLFGMFSNIDSSGSS